MVKMVIVGSAIALLAGIDQAKANGFCLTINKVARGEGFRSMSDQLIENGTCMASREAVDAIGRRDDISQTACVEATRHMVAEFHRRFPGRKPSETVGRC